MKPKSYLKNEISKSIFGLTYNDLSEIQKEFIDAVEKNYKNWINPIKTLMLPIIGRDYLKQYEHNYLRDLYLLFTPSELLMDAAIKGIDYAKNEGIPITSIRFLKNFIKKAILNKNKNKASLAVGTHTQTKNMNDPFFFLDWIGFTYEGKYTSFDFFTGGSN